jgi:hypothetical protein
VIFKQKFIDGWVERYDTHPEPCFDFHEDPSQLKYLCLTHNGYVHGFAIDIDTTGVTPESFVDANLPIPSCLSWNPESGHCHAVYMLKAPTKLSDPFQGSYSSDMVSNLVHAIQEAGIKATDRTKNATQNPYHPAFAKNAFFSGAVYTLGDLRETLPRRVKKWCSSMVGPLTAFEALGRNCLVFAKTIKWAQREGITDKAEVMRHALNVSSLTPQFFEKKDLLSVAEVDGIVKSVCSYGVGKYRKSQDARTRAAAARKARRNPTTVTERVKALGISKTTYYRKKLNTLQGAVKEALTRVGEKVVSARVPDLQDITAPSPSSSSNYTPNSTGLPSTLPAPPSRSFLTYLKPCPGTKKSTLAKREWPKMNGKPVPKSDSISGIIAMMKADFADVMTERNRLVLESFGQDV